MNRQTFDIQFIWVPHVLGGHSGPPWLGMRCQIRWERHLEESLRMSRDASCVALAFDPDTRMGTATLMLVSTVPEDWLQAGEVVQLKNAYHVLAVGKICPTLMPSPEGGN